MIARCPVEDCPQGRPIYTSKSGMNLHLSMSHPGLEDRERSILLGKWRESAVDMDIVRPTVADRMILHLDRCRTSPEGIQPGDADDIGISEALDINRERIGTEWNRRIKRTGLLARKKMRVPGRRVKVLCYCLTDAGILRAAELVEMIGAEHVDEVIRGTVRNVVLRPIDSIPELGNEISEGVRI